MSRLENFKTNFYEAKDVSKLADLLKDTEFNFTFFGYKKVSKLYFNKTLDLDKIASKAISLIKPFLNNWNFSLETRQNISYISKKINRYYEKMDRKYKKSNILSKIFYFIRNMFSWLFETRSRWDTLCLNIDPSIYYSAKQYRNAFNLNPLPNRCDKRYKRIKLYLKPTTAISA